MDNVITSLIVLDGEGGVNEYVGGYSDWEARGGSLSGARVNSTSKPVRAAKQTSTSQQNKPAAKKPKLSYKHQRELGNLPAKIEKLEKQKSLLEEQMSAPGFYQSDHQQVQQVSQELAKVQGQLEAAFNRWAELEGPE